RKLNAEVDPELSRILGKMIAKDPAERYQSCQELEADLAKHPLVAKGGAIALQTLPVVLEPLRRTGINMPIAAMSTNPDNATATTSAARTASATAIAASQPMLKRASPLSTAGRSKRYWAAGAALGLAAAASAWAFRADLPFAVPLLGTAVAPAPAIVPATPSVSATRTGDGLTNAGGATTAAAPTRSVNPDDAPADAADPALLDAMWLDDVPDSALSADASDAGAAYRPAAFPVPGYAPAYYGPYAYPSSLVPVAPTAYFAAAPWRIGFGFGIGVGYWASRIVAPTYVGPVLQPGFAWLHASSMVAMPVTATPTVAFAGRPLPSVAATSLPVRQSVGAAPAATFTAPANFVHNAPNAASQPLALNANAQPLHPRLAASLARANERLANQARLAAATPRVVHPVAVHTTVVRQKAPPRPRPKGERH
ncbi:MAG: hypothetical protein P4L92_10765, partial [Rudaea sp.]|nr:hypothetical protein [Rudaea sp.]